METPAGAPVATLLLRGDVDLALQRPSELTNVAGIDVVGSLPDEIQEITLFAGASCVGSLRRNETCELLAYCASPHTDAVKRRHGMGPS